MSKHFDYFNEQEKFMEESIPSTFKESGPVDINKKKEVQDFFKNRKFILDFLTPHQALVFSMCYGLQDGEFKNYKEIGSVLNISAACTSQQNLLAINTIKNLRDLNKYTLLTDESIGFDENIIWNRCRVIENIGYTKIEDIDVLKLEKTTNRPTSKVNLERAIISKIKTDISERHRPTKLVLYKLLSEKYIVSDKEKEYKIKSCMSNWWNIKNCTYEDILAIPTEKLKKEGLSELIEEMHNLGLHFTSEFEYQEEWRNSCLSGLLGFGNNAIKNRFGLIYNVQNENDIKNLLNNSIAKLGISSNNLFVLTKVGIKTIKDLISLSLEELSNIKVFNTKPIDIYNIIDKLHLVKLNLRPDNVFKQEYIDMIISKYAVEDTKSQDMIK